VNTTQKFVQVDNVSQFSPWTLSHQNYPLPVELVHLTAEWVAESKEHQARLQWQTIHEHGSDFFEIERSWDGIRFEGIGRVAAAGRSIEPRWYEYIDQVPSFAAVVYYRLRQVDLDGSHQYSRIVALHRQKNPDVLLVYPNPTTDWIEFKIRNVQNTSLPVEVIDNTGRVVYKGVALLGKEGNAYTLKTDNLPAGLYLLRITIEGDSFAAKFVIEK
ncbi:MAG: T9SS type A sorting domain-containing protein, partial [Bernardetiaceae bacterium]|nr:T9SS type A sorting domain-containing protein [Bernardetiaceae bacterium]